jgi:hypothetical protein
MRDLIDPLTDAWVARAHHFAAPAVEKRVGAQIE